MCVEFRKGLDLQFLGRIHEVHPGDVHRTEIRRSVLSADYQPNGAPPISPSSKTVKEGKITLPDYTQADFSAPHQVKKEELAGIVEDYCQAARNAREAGRNCLNSSEPKSEMPSRTVIHFPSNVSPEEHVVPHAQ